MYGIGTGPKTEYQRSFGKDQFVCAATTYRNNLAFRNEQERRSRGHYHEAFVWDSEDDDSDGPEERRRLTSEREDACFDRRRPPFVPPHQLKHVKWNRLRETKHLRPLSDNSSETCVKPKINEQNDRGVNKKLDSDNDSNTETVRVLVVNGMICLWL